MSASSAMNVTVERSLCTGLSNYHCDRSRCGGICRGPASPMNSARNSNVTNDDPEQ
jgi:hypothetical protein